MRGVLPIFKIDIFGDKKKDAAEHILCHSLTQIFRNGQPNTLSFHNVSLTDFVAQTHGQMERLNIKTLIHAMRSNVIYLPMYMNGKLKEQNN